LEALCLRLNTLEASSKSVRKLICVVSYAWLVGQNFTSKHRINHQIYNKELPLATARVQTQMSNKHNLVLYVDQELVERSRELGFNLSKTFENHLKQLLTQFSHVNSSNNSGNNGNVGDWWAGPDLNRRPLARKANVLTKLDDRPPKLAYFFQVLFTFSFGILLLGLFHCSG
jgi:hypothetical protein